MNRISETDIARSRVDLRFKQSLLTRALEQLLAILYGMEHDPAYSDAESLRGLRDGAIVAVELANLIRHLEQQRRRAESA